MASRLGDDLADSRRVGAERVRRACAASAASASSGATTATTLPSLATYSGSMPSRSHAPTTAGAIGSNVSSSTTPRSVSRASSLHTVPTPPRVGSRIQRVDGAASSSASTSSPSGGRVGADVGVEHEVAAGQHHRHAVIGHGARQQHDVARPDLLGAERAIRRDDADAGRRDVQPVGRALAHHLRVAGDDA